MRSKASLILNLIVVLSMVLTTGSTVVSAAQEAETTAAPPARTILGAPATLLSEDFESWPPAGWSILNNGGDCVWQSTAMTGRTNYTGGGGEAADADADWCGSGTSMDTELQTPTLDLGSVATATLNFRAAYNYMGGDYFEVLVSDNGGSSWVQELYWDSDHNAYGPGEVVEINLDAYTGSSDVIVSFHYYAAGWDWYALVDNVIVETSPPASVAFNPSSQRGAGCQGTDVVYDVEIMNTSGYTDTFDITAAGNDWDTTLGEASFYLPDGVSSTLAITVSVPTYAFCGETDVAEIQATAQTSPTITADATIETIAGSIWQEGPSNDATLWPAYASDGIALYYFDGLDDGGWATDQTQIFDPATGWATGGGHGLGNFYGGVAGYSSDTGEIYYAPGFVGGMNAVDAFVSYDPTTDGWTVLSSRPEALGLGAGGVTNDGNTFVWAGGSPDAGLLGYTPVYTYDIGTDIWFTATTLTDLGLTAPGYVMVDDKLYVGGNYTGSDAFYVYDAGDDTWAQLTDLPASKVSPLFIYDPVGNDIYMVGGGDLPSAASTETYVYDIDTDTWESFADLNNATLGNGGGYLSGTLFTYGGGADIQTAHASAPHEYALPQCPPRDTADLTGQVTNGVTGDPIEGAMIEAAGTAEGLMAQGLTMEEPVPVTWTDANGVYTLTLCAPAYYDITASYGSFDPQTENVHVTLAGPNEQDFMLGPPVANASPLSYIVTLPWSETEVQTMTLVNDGYSALSFELMEMPGGGPFVAQSTKESEMHPFVLPNQGEVGSLSADPTFATPDIPEQVKRQSVILQNNPVDDPGFENGPPPASGWNEWADNGCEWIMDPSIAWSIPAYAGTYTYWAGGYCSGLSSTDYVEQDVTLDGACQISFAANYYRSDLDDPTPDDMFYIEADGSRVWEKDLVQANNTYPNWMMEGPIDLGQFGGGAISLRIGADSTGSFTGNVLVDEVVVECSSGDILWLTEDPVTGTVTMQDVISPQLTFDAGVVMSLGTYTGTLTLETDDPDATAIEMPVQLNVVDNPNAGQIEGTVTSDRPGGPVEGAEVYLEAPSGFTDTLTTDATGYYERMIHPDDLGVFTITVSHPDYVTDVATATLGTTTVVHDVELLYNGPEMLVAPDAISETVMWGEIATATMTITNDGETDLDFDIYDYTTVYFEDFEVDNGGYQVIGASPSWEWGEPTTGPGAAYSGLNVWATNLDGAYNVYEESHIESPDIDLSAYAGGGLTVEWWEYVEVESGFDAWGVEVSNDGGETWTTIWGWYSGSTGDWINPAVNLPASYAVSDFRVRFGLSSDLSITYPGYYVDDVSITADPMWKSESLNSGTIVSHTTETITVTLNSNYAPGPGVYEAVEDVMGNDILNPQEIIPVTFTVLENPDQAYLSGTVLGNRTAAGMDMPLEGALVKVENMTNTFELETDASGFYDLYLLPSETGAYSVTVSHTGYISDVTSIIINKGDDLTHNVTLELIGAYLNADPEAVSETLPWGDTTDVTLTISNTLPGNEMLHVSMFEVAGSYTPPTVQTVQVELPASTAATPDAGVVLDDAYAPTTSARTVNVELLNLALNPIKVLIISGEANQGALDGLDVWLNAYPDIQAEVWYSVDGFPTLDDLSEYQVIIAGGRRAYSNAGGQWTDPVALGDLLADYVDMGGGVIMVQNAWMNASGVVYALGGRFETDYSPVDYKSDVPTPYTSATRNLGIYIAGHPLMDDVSSITDYVRAYENLTVRPYAEAVAYYDDGELYVAATPGDVVLFNQVHTYENNWDGDVPTLMHNAILYLAPADVPWLSESVTDFSLDVGEQATSTIGLDASMVDQPGTYNAWLWLENNDPLQTGAYIPVEMTVEVDPTMGVLRGVVTMDRHPLGLGLPAEDATVVMSDTLGIETMRTNASGQFVHYFSASDLPLDIDLTASYPDYQDDTTSVTLDAGETVTADMEVKLMAPWMQVTPPDQIEVTVVSGYTTTDQMMVENFGMTDLDIDNILEIPAGSPLEGKGQAQGNETWVDDPFSIDADVLDALQAEGSADFFIWMRERADLNPAQTISGIDVRREFVYEALTRTAERSQAGIIDYLESRGIEYETFWINNSILVRNGDQDVLDFVKARHDVARVRGVYTRMYIPDPEKRAIVTQEENGLNADPTWNIEIVKASDVWDQLNVTGEGAVVANIDTGVRYTHEALVDSYRGNLGGGTFNHNYNWGSIYGSGPSACPGAASAPCDWNGHGTHTIGTMVGGDGDDPFDMDIGMAPDAQWMACMGCDEPPDNCSDAALTGCAQWMVAPLDLDGENPDPTKAPDIVNNSWGGGGENDWYYSFVEAWNAANIIPIFSAGNAGPSCDTLGSPGSYDNVIGVGGTDNADNNYTYTSRGPGSGTGVFLVQKPDVAAPGEGVPSAVASGDSDYAMYSGTSMAAPHVAGLSALLRSVDPTIDRDTIWQILTSSAVTSTLNLKNGTWCGAGPDFPNYVFGHGRINAFDSVQYVLSGLDIPWLSVSPTTGVVQPALVGMNAYTGSMPVDVAFDATGMDDGVYTGTLRLLHNDPLAGQMDVLVKMTVITYEPVLTPTTDTMSGNPDATVPYTLTLTNNGSTTDTFDLAVSGNIWTTTVPSTVGPLAAGESADVTVEVDIPFSVHSGDEDTAVVTATSQGDPTQSASSTLTTTVAEQPVVLVVAKTAEPGDFVDPGDLITFTITVNNTGHDPVMVELSDKVPTYTTYVQGSVTGGLTYIDLPGKVEWSGTLTNGEERVFTFQVEVVEDVPPNTLITNTAIVMVDGEEFTGEVTVQVRPLIYLPIILNTAE